MMITLTLILEGKDVRIRGGLGSCLMAVVFDIRDTIPLGSISIMLV
jgi:hypothetical protein